MKKMLKDGKTKFVADALVAGYKKAGWQTEEEAAAPPHVDPEEGKTAPEGDAAETKFTCPVCGKEYKSETTLAKHIAEKHPGE